MYQSILYELLFCKIFKAIHLNHASLVSSFVIYLKSCSYNIGAVSNSDPYNSVFAGTELMLRMRRHFQVLLIVLSSCGRVLHPLKRRRAL
jgi:hypothetical protein